MDTSEIPVVDLGFVFEMSGNDSKYVSDVIGLFLSLFPEKLAELEKEIRGDADFTKIEEQAHFLKSSSSVIRIRDVFDSLARIETLAKEKTGRDEIIQKLDTVIANFREALPVLKAELANNDAAAS